MAMRHDDHDLAPWLIAPKSYSDLRAPIRQALGFPQERRPLLIGIDGLDGAGKTALASWLAWQLEMPVVHLDLYLIPESDPLAFRTADLARAIEARTSQQRPVIVEGVLLLRALDEIGRQPDFLIFVERASHASTLRGIQEYLNIFDPRAKTTKFVRWSSSGRDRQIADAQRVRRENMLG